MRFSFNYKKETNRVEVKKVTIEHDEKWEEHTIEERMEVVKMYNLYYNTDEQAFSFEQLNRSWTGCRWITIKYTFGTLPE
jgi:hypothetical protein